MSLCAQSQNAYTIKGKITDQNGEAIAGANVSIEKTSKGTFTNSNGDYQLYLNQGDYTLAITSIGYESELKKIKLDKNLSVNISLKTKEQDLQEITITSKEKSRNVSSVQMSVNTISAEVISKMPQLMGEVDVIKVMQLMPGVNQSSEGSSGYSVRGGTTDQNLILLDGSNIYNPSHLLGFFSVFNNDVVDNVTMYRSGFPPEHGGRLSSVLEVQTNSECDEVISGNLGIGLISSRAMLNGSTKDKKFYWSVAGRRSYADLFLLLPTQYEMPSTYLYFYDFNAKAVYKPTDNDVISLGSYLGRDRLGMDLLNFAYGNSLVYSQWAHKFNNKLSSTLNVDWSKYSYTLESDMYIDKITWDSSISSPSASYKADYFINPNNKLTLGTKTFYHFLTPGDVDLYDGNSYTIENYNALELSIFAQDEHTFYNDITITGTLRYNIFSNKSESSPKTYNTLDYRLGAVFPLKADNSIKLNVERNNQFIQWANNSASGSPMNVWFAASSNIKPQVLYSYSVGYFQNLNNDMFELSGEIYYKDYHNVIDFADNANLFASDIQGEVRSGKGKGYGIELMAAKTSGKLTGFINYTFSHSEYTIEEINNGKTYLSPYDRPHAVNVSVNYELNKKWDFSLLWVYYTGAPASFPESTITINGEVYNVFYERNTYRYLDYHRLDLSVNFTPKPEKKRWRSEYNVSIYNVYNRKNTWMYGFNEGEVTNYYLFGIIPSFTYNLNF
ncbi:MAG: TonB-dependent receptor [Rikenellaceae bacterium]